MQWFTSGDEELQRVVIVDFVLYMHGDARLGNNEVLRILTALRHRFVCDCVKIDAFTDASVIAVKDSLRRATDRERNLEKEKKKRLPVTLDFVQKARTVLWNVKDLDRSMTYIGIMLAFNFM